MLPNGYEWVQRCGLLLLLLACANQADVKLFEKFDYLAESRERMHVSFDRRHSNPSLYLKVLNGTQPYVRHRSDDNSADQNALKLAMVTRIQISIRMLCILFCFITSKLVEETERRC